MRGAVLLLAIAAVLAGAASLLVASKRADQRRLRVDLIQDVERGGIADLGRARALGRRLVLVDPNDREAAAALAFTGAALAVDYGIDTARETEALLQRLGGRAGEADLSDLVQGMAEAARALMELRAGDRAGATRRAAAASAAAPGIPHPLYALGRARAAGGDLLGAARALEAAIVGAPGFAAARVGWAEVRLDLGDARSARATLENVLAQSPKDLRARLLLDEAEQALGAGATQTLASACAHEPWAPAAVVAGCALAEAGRARHLGARAEARARAEAAERAAPDEPRLLARTAQALAQLGEIDRAAALVVRAQRWWAADAPAVAWAAAALALGHGAAGWIPGGLRPAGPEVPLIVARAALAAGGAAALARALDALGEPAIARDADLRQLARVRARREPVATPDTAAPEDPVRAYVDGVRARLDRDLPAAAEHFGHALWGHGDACRAAGEYVATLRALKRHTPPGALIPLRGENRDCVNLP